MAEGVKYYYEGELPAHTSVFNHGKNRWDTIEYKRTFTVTDPYQIQEVLSRLVEAGVLSLTPPKKET